VENEDTLLRSRRAVLRIPPSWAGNSFLILFYNVLLLLRSAITETATCISQKLYSCYTYRLSVTPSFDHYIISFLMAQHPLVGQGVLIIEASPSHSVTALSTSDQPASRDLYLTTHNIHKRQTYMLREEFRTRSLSKWDAADTRLKQRGHWIRYPIM